MLVGDTFMDIKAVAETIQIIIAPVVMVTACAILVGGLLSRYAAINDRLRVMARERLDLLAARQMPHDEHSVAALIHTERLTQIDTQIPLLLQHHKLAHDSVLAVYAAAVVFIADMFVIALITITHSDGLAAGALIVFLIGVVLLLLGVVLTALEVRTSHRALHYEVQRVAGLTHL